MPTTSQNIDPHEVAKFDAAAARWWDPSGEFKPLHDINPLRLDYIDAHARVSGKRVLDVGCGGGLLAEAMAAKGADVTGIDISISALQVAKLHLLESGLKVDYCCVTAEELAEKMPAAFDVVSCMEMLEHVPDPASIIKACAKLVKPGGHVFFSTLNRTPKAYLLGVIGAEYILNLLPRGTHDYAKFIRPSELAAWVRSAGLQLRELNGMSYNPFSGICALTQDVDVNYLAHAIAAHE